MAKRFETTTDAPPAQPTMNTEYLSATVLDEDPLHVRLVVFGRATIIGPYPTPEAAIASATKWNEYLGEEWQRIRATNAAIIQAFSEKLRAEGVCNTALLNAMRAVKSDLDAHGG